MHSRSLRWLVPFALLFGCGGSDRAEPAGMNAAGSGDMESSTEDADTSASGVQLSLAGVASQLEGGARLEVREQNPVVNLVVTAVYADNHDDLVQLQLALDGVANAMGHHTSVLAGESSRAYAVAYIDLASYLSQTGTLDVTLKGDGSIEGSFDAQLAPLLPTGAEAALLPPASAAAAPLSLSGSFQGSWSLLCRSPVQSLPGDHSVSNSPYCNNLSF